MQLFSWSIDNEINILFEHLLTLQSQVLWPVEVRSKFENLASVLLLLFRSLWDVRQV